MEKNNKNSKKRLRVLLIVAALIVLLLIALCLIFNPFKEKTCLEHVDKNNDGICDSCKNSCEVVLDFYVINDLHGKFSDSSSQPGVDELTMLLKESKMVGKNTILLSSGDMWQGSTESNQTKGMIITDWMNELDFKAHTLGNHEFDWGEEAIKENLEFASFPFLAINIYSEETDELVDYCEPSTIIEDASGARIGVIGAIGDCYSSIAVDKTKGIYFIVGDELTELVEAEATRLREEGADIIVYCLHDGYDENVGKQAVITDSDLDYYTDSELSDYIDIFFEGHTHKSYVLMDKNQKYHLQDGGENRGISHVEAKVNIANEENEVLTAEVIPSTDFVRHVSDSLRDNLLEKYSDSIAFAYETLGTISKDYYSDDIKQLVADCYLNEGIAKWGSDYDIVLGGGFISVRNPYNLMKGDVNYSNLQSLLPFDNELVLCSISGADLLRVFINSDNDNYFYSLSEYGESVIEDINPIETYYVIVDSYSSPYEPNNLTEIERLGENYYARDMIAKLITNGELE